MTSITKEAAKRKAGPRISEGLRGKFRKQRRSMNRSFEVEFADALATAAEKLPKHADKSLFPFIVRQLFTMPDTAEDWATWSDALPDRFEAFCREHEWPLKDTAVRYAPPSEEAMSALARLLIVVRQKKLAEYGPEGDG